MPLLTVLSVLFFSSAIAGGPAMMIPPPSAMPHWYVGAGPNKLAVNRITYNEPNNETLTLDGNDTYGFQVFVGHQQNDYFAIELGYADIPRMRLTNIDITPSRSFHIIADLWDVYLQGLFRYPVISHTFYAFVKGGIAFFNSEQHFDFIDNTTPDQEGTSSFFVFAYSAGVEFSENNWGVRLAYNGFVSSMYFEFTGGGFPHINYIDLSLIYRFGG